MTDTKNMIVTHPGIFHADEVFAVVWIKLSLNENDEVNIVRRNPTEEKIQDNGVLVLDAGGEYNPEKLNFDHRAIKNPQGGIQKYHIHLLDLCLRHFLIGPTLFKKNSWTKKNRLHRILFLILIFK